MSKPKPKKKKHPVHTEAYYTPRVIRRSEAYYTPRVLDNMLERIIEVVADGDSNDEHIQLLNNLLYSCWHRLSTVDKQDVLKEVGEIAGIYHE